MKSNKTRKNNQAGRRQGMYIIAITSLLLLLIVTSLFLAGDRLWDQGSKAQQMKKSGLTAEKQNDPPGESLAQGTTENATESLTANNTESLTEQMTEQNTESSEQSAAQKEEEKLTKLATDKLATMTLEQKVAQLFMIVPEALTGTSQVTQASQATLEQLKKYPVGGIIYFPSNFNSPDQVTKMTSDISSYGMQVNGLPILLATDEEGGRVTRIASNTSFPVRQFSDMWDIGATGDASQAYNVGSTIGTYLHQYGINLDFAPDADVLTNPDNKVIGRRSFGTDPQLVAEMSWQYAKGLEDQKVIACLKHFPGHGGTAGDTHEGYAFTDKTLEELKTSELIPFQNGIDQGASMIMAAHIAAPKVTGDNTPASLSSVLITDVLRKQMGYQGVVITDALNMGAITKQYSSDQAAVKAIQAGADIVLMPKDFAAAYQGVLKAVSAQTITEDRINESLTRILKLKYKMMEQ